MVENAEQMQANFRLIKSDFALAAGATELGGESEFNIDEEKREENRDLVEGEIESLQSILNETELTVLTEQDN